MFYIYCVHSEYTDKQGLKKLGLTIHPVHRMRQYDIGDAPGVGLEKRYEGLWQVNANDRQELHEIEAELHAHFADRRQPRENGRSSEWFRVSFDEMEAYMSRNPRVIRRISTDEIATIEQQVRAPRTREDRAVEREERELIEDQEDRLLKPEVLTLYSKFLQIFLGGNQPRRVQAELWKLFTVICSNPEDICYKGIIQWPTGVGKTIAILMLIVIAKDRCDKRGETYRGLFISPMTDILDTITKEFEKLSHFGITFYDGSHAQIKKVLFPSNQHLLITTCQKSVTFDADVVRLPKMTHVHYDEVHRITGDLFFANLKKSLDVWKTEILTGTSATPFTASQSQRDKVSELFGIPLTLLHQCGVDEAVQEGWIAKPRFIVCVLPPIDETDAHLRGLVSAVGKYVLLKNTGGKFIVYVETSTEDAWLTAEIARELLPWARIYTALDGARSDAEFVAAPVDKMPRILIACQRYREGSNIRGLEMTVKLLGDTFAAYLILQVCGRAGRIDDNPNKEGWCLLVRPSPQGTTAQDVLESFLLNILECLKKQEGTLTKKEIHHLLTVYVGDVMMNGSSYSVEHTVERVQAAYVRAEYSKRTPKEKYSLIRDANRELGLRSRNHYQERHAELPTYIANPREYFKEWWVSWYHFLGLDTSAFPKTKADWIRVCKERDILTWEQYKSIASADLPQNPSEFYEDFTNWDKEMGLEEEIIW